VTANVASKHGAAKAEAAQQAQAPVPVAAAPAPVAQPASGAPTTEALDDLMKLKGLLDAGALTQEEFDAQKQKILAG
jgi:predicted flap endonuclease-1-like 5' DNA nuclease